MNEGQSRIRNENAPEILTIMRKWSLNIASKHKGDLSVKRMLQKIAMPSKNLLALLQKI